METQMLSKNEKLCCKLGFFFIYLREAGSGWMDKDCIYLWLNRLVNFYKLLAPNNKRNIECLHFSLCLKRMASAIFFIVLSMPGFTQTDSLKVLKGLSFGYFISEKYNESAECLKEISDIYASNGDIKLSIDYYNKYVNSLKFIDPKQALESSNLLLEKVDKYLNDSIIDLDLWLTYNSTNASIREINGQYELAIVILKIMSAKIFISNEVEKNLNWLINTHYELSDAYNDKGDQINSIRSLESIEAFVNLEEHKIKYFKKLADLYSSIGNYEVSNQWLFKTLDILDCQSMDYAVCTNLVGNNYSKLGNPILAIQFYLESLDVRKENVCLEDPKLGVIYHNLGNMYKLIGKKTESFNYYFKALNLYKLKSGETSEQVGFTYNSIGNYYFDLEEYDSALYYYNKGLENRLLSQGNKNPFILHSYYNIANSYLKMGQFDLSDYYINCAISNNPKYADSYNNSYSLKNLDFLRDLAFSYRVKGELYYQRSLNDNSIENTGESLNFFRESVQAYYGLLKIQNVENSKFPIVPDLKKSIIGTIRSQLLLEQLTEKKNPEILFDLFEKAHNSQLFELVKLVQKERSITFQQDDPLSKLNISQKLASKFTADTNYYSQNTAEIIELYNQLFKYNEKTKGPNHVFDSPDSVYLDFETFKNIIPKNTLVLQFLVSKETDQTFFLSISRDWYNYGLLGNYTDFKSAGLELSRSMNRFELTSGNFLKNEFYSIISKAFPKELNNYNRLIVIPDDFLWQIPFDAISSPFGTARYLIDDFDVSFHMSCNLLCFNSEVNDSKYSLDFIGYAPSFMDTHKGELNDIPYAREEVLKASDILGAKGYKSYCFVDDNANLRNFFNSDNNARIVHIASHYNYKSNDNRLGLLFNSNDYQDSLEIIGYDEVLMAGKNPELAVLSACKTIHGPNEIEGEGPINLNRAFVLNGSRFIIYSIYKVNDKYSNDFFKLFYSNLNAEFDYEKAFHQTKKGLRKNPVYSNPYYWSTFQIISTL